MHANSNAHGGGLSDLVGRTVLVTGGAGLIGSRIRTRLKELGARPLILCTLDAYPSAVYRDMFGVDASRDPDVIAGDIQDGALVRRQVARSDYVIHAAALADVAACTREPMRAIATNITGTQIVLDAVAEYGHVRRLVFVSSASVYGNGNPEAHATPVDEHRTTRELVMSVYGRTPPAFHEYAACRPMSVYGNTKSFGETQTVLTLGRVGLSYAVVRYFSVYGEPQVIKPHSHSWVVAWFATRAALGLTLHLNGGGHQIRDLVHVDDIAEGTLRALTEPAADRETINIGTGIPTAIRRVAELVRDHYPATAFLETPMPSGDPLGGYAATQHMRRLLNWTPAISVDEGVDRYVRWLRGTPDAVPTWLRDEAGAR
ncbi:NAD-dependent epimerase/dehydratase family protein [Streptomyces sp. NPDC054861]